MGICTYFLNNNCRFGSKCNNDHIDLSSVIKSEVEVTLKGNQWPLSCFGPFKERNCVPNFIEDVSFEEIRMMYLEAKMQNNIPGHQMQLMQMINEAKQKMQWLTTTNRDIMSILIEIYNQQDDSSKTPAAAGGNPFAAPIGSATSAASIFGGASGSSSGFGTGSSAFGASNTTAGNIFGAAPNQSAANIFGSGPATPIGGNIFSKPQTATTTPNIFGTPTLGQPQQQTNSVFGGPPVFGASGPSLFSTPSPNPQAAAGGSIFGNASANTSSGNLFTQPSMFGQPASNQNMFAAAAQSQPAGSPFTAAPAPASNLFANTATFAASTVAQPQQQQNMFTSGFSVQQSGAPFGQPGQQQQQSTQGLFLPAPQTAAQPPTMASTQPPPFGTTVGAFGGNTQQSTIPMTNSSATVYSRVEDLTKEQLDAFSADRFELGKIPTMPPPREMCN